MEMNKMRDHVTVTFEDLKGKVLTKIKQRYNDALYFETSDGEVYGMSHYQDCCESVYIEDICGDLDDLLNTPILLAEEVSSGNETPEGLEEPEYRDSSYTWTFYKLSTIKGSVTIRWFGTSNGYYSESVDFYKV
jgi:hypothetical protein